MDKFIAACQTLQFTPNLQAAQIWNEAIHYCVGALVGKVDKTGILPSQAVTELYQMLIKNEHLRQME